MYGQSGMTTVPSDYYYSLERQAIALKLLLQLGRLSIEDLVWLEEQTGHKVLERVDSDADTKY